MFILLQHSAQPYISRADNVLNVCSQWALLVVLLCALVLQTQALQEDGVSEQDLGVVLVAVSVLVLVASALLALNELRAAVMALQAKQRRFRAMRIVAGIRSNQMLVARSGALRSVQQMDRGASPSQA